MSTKWVHSQVFVSYVLDIKGCSFPYPLVSRLFNFNLM